MARRVRKNGLKAPASTNCVQKIALDLDRDGAIEEIVADASGEALSRLTEAQIQEMAQENPTLLKKIARFMKKWIGDLKKQIEIAFRGTEAKTEVARQMQDALDEMAEMWNQLLVESGKKANEGSAREASPAAQTQQTTSPAAQTTQTTAETSQNSDKAFIPYAHIDERSLDSVKEMHTELFCSEVEEARFAYAAAASVLMDDLEWSAPGQKQYNWDKHGDLTVTGLKRVTSEMLARMKDGMGWTWDDIRKTLQSFIDMNDSAKGYPLVKNTVRNRRMEVYLHEMLTKGYTTIDGTRIAPWREYVEAMAAYQGSKGVGLNAQDFEGAAPFEEYVFAGEFEDDGDVKYSVRKVDGKDVVWIEDNILATKPKDQKYTDFVHDYLIEHIGEVYTIIESGRKVYLGSDLPGEYTGSRYTKRIRNKGQDAFYAKNRSVSGIGEAIEIATNRRWEKAKHPDNKDAKYGVYRYSTKVAFPAVDYDGNITNVHAYTADLLIRNASDGKKYLYDIINIKNDAISADRLLKRESARSANHASKPQGIIPERSIAQDDESVKFSMRVTDPKTLDFLNGQETVTTYKTMQVVDGRLYPPMAAVVAGAYEDASQLGAWEQATERPDLIKTDKKGKSQFALNKGQGKGIVPAAYNPYMHSSNLVLNDQFSSAYDRPNLVTVECEVPVSELTSGYRAQHAKDAVGWHSWHTGTVAGDLRKATGIERRVLLSRWIKPVRIIPNAEVAAMYKELLEGTTIAVPDNVVPPALLAELKKAGVPIAESGKVRAGADVKYDLRPYSEHQKENWANSKSIVVYENEAQLQRFINDALEGQNLGKKMYFGIVSGALAERVKSETDYKGDIAGYNCSIAAQEIRKIAKDHGDPLIESKRGQRAVIADDYLKVPDVIEQADKITLSSNTYNEKPALIFKKRIDGSDMSVVGVISNKRMDLFVQTMYASANKKSLATPTDEQASANTPEATRGTALDGIVAQGAGDVNPDTLYQQRDPDQISDREPLATALQNVTQNLDEWDNLRRYQKKIAALNEKQRMLEETDARIVELKGRSDRASRDEMIRLQNNARTLARSIERADGELLKYEAMNAPETPLRGGSGSERASFGCQRSAGRGSFRDATAIKPIKKLAERQREEYRQTLKARTDERMRKYKERMRQDMQDRLRDVRAREAERGKRRLDKAVEHAREVGNRRVDRIRESEGRAKYKERIQKDVSTLRDWLTQPTNKGHVPQFLRAIRHLTRSRKGRYTVGSIVEKLLREQNPDAREKSCFDVLVKS